MNIQIFGGRGSSSNKGKKIAKDVVLDDLRYTGTLNPRRYDGEFNYLNDEGYNAIYNLPVGGEFSVHNSDTRIRFFEKKENPSSEYNRETRIYVFVNEEGKSLSSNNIVVNFRAGLSEQKKRDILIRNLPVNTISLKAWPQRDIVIRNGGKPVKHQYDVYLDDRGRTRTKE